MPPGSIGAELEVGCHADKLVGGHRSLGGREGDAILEEHISTRTIRSVLCAQHRFIVDIDSEKVGIAGHIGSGFIESVAIAAPGGIRGAIEFDDLAPWGIQNLLLEFYAAQILNHDSSPFIAVP